MTDNACKPEVRKKSSQPSLHPSGYNLDQKAVEEIIYSGPHIEAL